MSGIITAHLSVLPPWHLSRSGIAAPSGLYLTHPTLSLPLLHVYHVETSYAKEPASNNLAKHLTEHLSLWWHWLSVVSSGSVRVGGISTDFSPSSGHRYLSPCPVVRSSTTTARIVGSMKAPRIPVGTPTVTIATVSWPRPSC